MCVITSIEIAYKLMIITPETTRPKQYELRAKCIALLYTTAIKKSVLLFIYVKISKKEDLIN